MWPTCWFRNRAKPLDRDGVTILAISISLDDGFLLERLAKRHRWVVRLTNTPQEAFDLAAKGHYQLILCDRNQRGYPWREVMNRLAGISPRSCILLVAPSKQDYVWSDVLQQGGHDVLTHPLEEDAVLQMVTALPFISAGQASEPLITKRSLF